MATYGILNISDSRSLYYDDFDIAKIDLTDTSVRTGLVLGTQATLLALVGLVVSARIYSRVGITGRLFAEDVFMILAAVCAIVFFTSSIASVKYGVGKHIWTINILKMQSILQNMIQLMFIGHIFTQASILFTKLSILVLYHRLFPGRAMRISCISLGIFFVLFYGASMLAVIFQCTPVEATWRLDLDAKCFDFVKVLYAIAAVNIATDIVLCLMPVGHFRKLQLPRKQKVILSILFMGGGVACIAAIMRITTLRGLYNFDITYSIVPSLLWCTLEASLAIICVSIPALRPLVARFFPSLFRSTNRTHSNRNPKSGQNIYQLSGIEGQRRTKPSAASANRRSILDPDDDDITVTPAELEEGKGSGGRNSFGSGSGRTTEPGSNEVAMVDSTEELTGGKGGMNVQQVFTRELAR